MNQQDRNFKENTEPCFARNFVVGQKIQTGVSEKIVYSWIPLKTIQKPREFQVTNRSWFNPLQGRLQDAKNKTTAEEKHRVLLRFN